MFNCPESEMSVIASGAFQIPAPGDFDSSAKLNLPYLFH